MNNNILDDLEKIERPYDYEKIKALREKEFKLFLVIYGSVAAVLLLICLLTMWFSPYIMFAIVFTVILLFATVILYGVAALLEIAACKFLPNYNAESVMVVKIYRWITHIFLIMVTLGVIASFGKDF